MYHYVCAQDADVHFVRRGQARAASTTTTGRISQKSALSPQQALAYGWSSKHKHIVCLCCNRTGMIGQSIAFVCLFCVGYTKRAAVV